MATYVKMINSLDPIKENIAVIKKLLGETYIINILSVKGEMPKKSAQSIVKLYGESIEKFSLDDLLYDDNILTKIDLGVFTKFLKSENIKLPKTIIDSYKSSKIDIDENVQIIREVCRKKLQEVDNFKEELKKYKKTHKKIYKRNVLKEFEDKYNYLPELIEFKESTGFVEPTIKEILELKNKKDGKKSKRIRRKSKSKKSKSKRIYNRRK